MKLYYDTDEEDSYVIADQKMWGRKESSKQVMIRVEYYYYPDIFG